MQNGNTYAVDNTRAYDATMRDVETHLRGDEKVYVVQEVPVENSSNEKFLYTYNCVNGNYYLTNIELVITNAGNESRYSGEYITLNGEKYNFFHINEDVISYSVAGGRIFIETKLPENEALAIDEKTAIILEISAGIVAVEAILLVAFKLKERSILKNDEVE
jgi:predicted ThiF/HesA family dinucleotide-utilizing enzyme